MRKEIMQALQQEYEQQRLKNSQEEMRRRQEVITRCPEIGQYLAERQNLIFGGVRGILNGKAAADDPGRIAAHHGHGRHVSGHDGACRYNGPVPYANASQDDGAVPNPHVAADDRHAVLPIPGRIPDGATGPVKGMVPFSDE